MCGDKSPDEDAKLKTKKKKKMKKKIAISLTICYLKFLRTRADEAAVCMLNND